MSTRTIPARRNRRIGSAGAAMVMLVASVLATTVASSAPAGAAPPYDATLRVTTSPAVNSQIIVDGTPRDNWGLDWMSITSGEHEVCFSDVPGSTTPPCQTIDIAASTTAVVTGTFARQGYLHVTTEPAVDATITVDGVRINNWGTFAAIDPGTHEVCYIAAAGYATPPCETVVVTAGQTTNVIGHFVAGNGLPGPKSGRLRVTTSPAVDSRIIVDGTPRDNWGLDWMSIPVGSHTVCFSDVPGRTTPPCETVTVTAGQTTTVTGMFTSRGYIQATTTPALDATISIDGVDRNNWGVYTEITPGAHQVCWAYEPGRITPDCQDVFVSSGATATATGTYTTITPTITGATQLTGLVATGCAVVGGKARCWGNNESGQVGNGTTTTPVITPYQLPLTNVTRVVNGGSTTCALAAAKAWCWGANFFGQVGNGMVTAAPVPTPYQLPLTDVTDIEIGNGTVCAIAAGKAWCWGSTFDGTVGNGTVGGGVATPYQLPLTDVTDITPGFRNTCAIAAGEAWCWGNNLGGQVGAGTVGDPIATPSQVPLTGVTRITVAISTICAVANGDAWCWGANDGGYVGNGTTVGPVTTPYKSMSDVDDIVNGDSATCAIKNGELWCWGFRVTTANPSIVSGQVVPSPEKLPLSGVTRVSMTKGFTVCAIAQGDVWCWGDNRWGQAGNGTIDAVVEPFRLPLTGATEIVQSDSISCAIAQGNVWCWGENGHRWLRDVDGVDTILDPYGPL